jgi:hypothetical protein
VLHGTTILVADGLVGSGVIARLADGISGIRRKKTMAYSQELAAKVGVGVTDRGVGGKGIGYGGFDGGCKSGGIVIPSTVLW